MPSFSTSDLLQVLILATGIYLVLTLLRTARGSGLVRGLGVTVLVLGLGLYGLANALELRELQQVLDAILGVATIVLAILFQPELRRGILSLGDHQLFGRFLSNHGPSTIEQVAEATIDMARKRQGALIAFERKTPLDALSSAGVAIDAPVTAELLDSIFHPGAALHDGAVVVRDGKVSAAAVLFPLSENGELSKSTGTRHRAALGLVEQSDAVAVVVSEETGSISICADGKMERRIARDKFADALGERLGLSGAAAPERAGLRQIAKSVFGNHLGQKAIALVIGAAVFLVASNQVTETRFFDIRLSTNPTRTTPGPVAGELTIQAPTATGDGVPKVFEVGIERAYQVKVVGPREEMQQFEDGLGGTITLDPGSLGEIPLDAASIRWGVGRYANDLVVTWEGKQANSVPRVDVRLFKKHKLVLREELVTLDDIHLESAGLQVQDVVFKPTEATVLSPAEVDDLEQLLSFVTLKPSVPDDGPWSAALELDQAAKDRGFELLESVLVEASIVPEINDLGTVDKDIVLVSFKPGQDDPYERFAPPTRTARLRVRATSMIRPGRGIDPADVNVALREIVGGLARVYVDVNRMANDGSRLAPIEVDPISPEVWRAALSEPLAEQLDLSPTSQLIIELEMDEAALVLEPLEDAESEEGGGEEPRENL